MSEPESKFTIKCNSCGSTNCELQELYDYTSDGTLGYFETQIVCLDCGERE